MEFLRCGALEAVDGLFFIADDEDGAFGFGRSGACREFFCECFDDAPLLGVGVLRLVDEDVVDAAVEFVEHPFGAALEQGAGHENEVVEIKRGLREFQGLIVRDDFATEDEKVAGEERRCSGVHAVEKFEEAFGFGLHYCGSAGCAAFDIDAREFGADLAVCFLEIGERIIPE